MKFMFTNITLEAVSILLGSVAADFPHDNLVRCLIASPSHLLQLVGQHHHCNSDRRGHHHAHGVSDIESPVYINAC